MTPERNYTLAGQIVQRIALKRIKELQDLRDDTEIRYETMTEEEQNSYEGDDDDLTMIIDSIQFWSKMIKPNPKSKIERDINKICDAKVNIMMGMLEKVPDMSKFKKFITSLC